ncbi:hypothetical protein GA0115253_100761, partial [Streptomyces sp. Termitarium-T10T-6]
MSARASARVRRSPAATPAVCAHAYRLGPGSTGPSISTDASVYTVTCEATVFISRSRDWSV